MKEIVIFKIGLLEKNIGLKSNAKSWYFLVQKSYLRINDFWLLNKLGHNFFPKISNKAIKDYIKDLINFNFNNSQKHAGLIISLIFSKKILIPSNALKIEIYSSIFLVYNLNNQIKSFKISLSHNNMDAVVRNEFFILKTLEGLKTNLNSSVKIPKTVELIDKKDLTGY